MPLVKSRDRLGTYAITLIAAGFFAIFAKWFYGFIAVGTRYVEPTPTITYDAYGNMQYSPAKEPPLREWQRAYNTVADHVAKASALVALYVIAAATAQLLWGKACTMELSTMPYLIHGAVFFLVIIARLVAMNYVQ